MTCGETDQVLKIAYQCKVDFEALFLAGFLFRPETLLAEISFKDGPGGWIRELNGGASPA